MSSRGLAIWDEPLYYENVCRPTDIIMPGSREYNGKDQEAMVRKQRIEEIGRRYLDGHCPMILTASLRGPFTQQSGWWNPWKSQVPAEEEVLTISSDEESENEIEETYMGQAASQLVQESQQYGERCESPQASHFKNVQQPINPSSLAIPFEDEEYLSSNTNALIQGQKRSTSAEWLKVANKSKRPRWDTPDRGSPTPKGIPTSHRKQKTPVEKTPPSKIRNGTPLASGSFNFVRLVATKTDEAQKKTNAGLKRRHSEKNDGTSDTDKLAQDLRRKISKSSVNHRRAVSAQFVPEGSNVLQLSKAPMHSSQSTPQMRIPDLQDEFAARISGTSLAKHFKSHWAELFAKQNSSSPLKSSSQSQQPNKEATPMLTEDVIVPGMGIVEDDEEPEPAEYESAVSDIRDLGSLNEFESGVQQKSQHQFSEAVEDISMVEATVNSEDQSEIMDMDETKEYSQNSEVGLAVNQQPKSHVRISIEAEGSDENDNPTNVNIDEEEISHLELATPIHDERSGRQTEKLSRSAKRRRSRQRSRELKALTKRSSMDRSRSKDALSTSKSDSQRATSSFANAADPLENTPSPIKPESQKLRDEFDADQTTQDADISLQDAQRMTEEIPDNQVNLVLKIVDEKHIPEVTSQNLSTPAQSPKTPNLENSSFEIQSASRAVPDELIKSQEKVNQPSILQSSLPKSTPQRIDTPDATPPSESDQKPPTLHQPSQRDSTSASRSRSERPASITQSQKITAPSQRISASQQSSWHRSPKKSTSRKWQPPADAEPSSDEDMDDIPARKPGSQPLAENINTPGKPRVDEGHASQKSVVSSQTSTQKRHRKSTSKTWQPPSDAAPSTDDDMEDIPAKTSSQQSLQTTQSSPKSARSTQRSSRASIHSAQNPNSPLYTASSTVGTPSPRRSARKHPTPNTNGPQAHTQSPWAPPATLENALPIPSRRKASSSFRSPQPPPPAQTEERHSTPEENFIRPISAFITPSPKKPSNKRLPPASLDPLLNPWAENPSPTSTRTKKRVSFAAVPSPSPVSAEKPKLHSPPPPPSLEAKDRGDEDVGGVGEKLGLFSRKVGASFGVRGEMGSQAPVWAYGEAFRAADGLVGVGVGDGNADGVGVGVGDNDGNVDGVGVGNGNADVDGLGNGNVDGDGTKTAGFDMQKFLLEGDGGLEMPQEEYWDAEMYAGGRGGDGIW